MSRLFEIEPEPPKPRQKPRKLMHVIDAGPGFDKKDMVLFKCGHCGHEPDWMLCGMTEAKRGIPCPKCNAE